MIGAATAAGGRSGRKKSLRAVAVAIFLAAAAVVVCLGLEIVLDPVPVEIPKGIEAGMVYCSAAGDRGTVPAGGFWIDRFEVTVTEFRDFLETGRPPPVGSYLWNDPSASPGSLPVRGVTLFDARAFAEWRGKRLPTSPEWEWSARGSNGFRYPWGPEFSETFANTAELDLWMPTSVGTFWNGRSPFGVFDLVGNVWEWTESRAAGFAVRYVARGGSCVSSGYSAMDAPELFVPGEEETVPFEERGRAEAPEKWSADLGFRCVADPAAVAQDGAFRDALAKIGGRDPIRIFFQVRPALAELSSPAARRVVESALAVNDDSLVKRRLEGILRAGR